MKSSFQISLESKHNYIADVVVVGGGPSGVCAAVAAARSGVSTILIEQGGCAGGMATRGLVGPFMTCYDKSGENMIIRGLFEEVVDRLVKHGGAIHPSLVHKGTTFTSWISVGHEHVTPFDPEILKVVMDQMLEEAGVRVLYHTTVVRPILDDNTLRGVVVYSKSGFEEVRATIAVDCSGDADIACQCGVPTELGDQELRIIQPATMFFRIGNVDTDVVDADVQANALNFYRKDGVNYRSLHWHVSEARKNGDWTIERVSVGMFRGVRKDEWNINTSRIMNVDPTDNESLTYAEIEGRRQVGEIFAFFRKYVPGCENARLLSVASTIGIRESRHICGEYQFTKEDILHGVVPEDSILLASNSVDVHGRFGPASNEYLTIENGEYYGVPFRCLVPVGVEQLLVAGRCVSATSEAAGAIRVMPPAMGLGQAAGVAAAIAVKFGKTVREIDTALLREELKKQGAYL